MSVRFFQPRFSSPNFPIAIAAPSNLQYCVFIQHFKNLFSIFAATIFAIKFPSSAIAGPSNYQYCIFDCPAIVKGGGGGERMMKIVVEKIEDYEVGQLFFDVYQHLAELDDELDGPRSTR